MKAQKIFQTIIGVLALMALAGCASESKGNAVNKENIRRVHDMIYNKGDFREFNDLYSPDYIRYSAGKKNASREELKQAIIEMRTAFPDLQITIDDMVMEGETEAHRYTSRGTNTGPLKLPGGKVIPPTGKTVTFTGMIMQHVKDGKIIESFTLFDEIRFAQQLGLIPSAK